MYGKDTASSCCGLHAYGSPLLFKNSSGKIKPYAGTFGLLYDGMVTAIETPENPVDFFLGDADSLVFYFQADIAVEPVEPYRYRSVRRGIFDGVVQNICDGFGGPASI